MRILTALLLTFAWATVWSAESPEIKNPPLGELLPERGAIMPKEAVPGLFNQMSRPAPVFTGSVWTPNADDIARFEKLFPAFYEKNTKVRYLSLNGYCRQSAGFITKDGQRLIYANFLPYWEYSKELQQQDPQRYGPDLWKTYARVIGDGGGRYFGVVFDPATNQFSQFEKNGF